MFTQDSNLFVRVFSIYNGVLIQYPINIILHVVEVLNEVYNTNGFDCCGPGMSLQKCKLNNEEKNRRRARSVFIFHKIKEKHTPTSTGIREPCNGKVTTELQRAVLAIQKCFKWSKLKYKKNFSKEELFPSVKEFL